MNNFSFYQSPFSWRYGSEKMRQVFSEENKFRIWRRIWVELAKAQYKLGLVSKRELDDLKKYQEDIHIQRILEIEQDTQHDVVAAIKEFAEKAKIGGGKIHLGATSVDITDNADTIRAQEALEEIELKLKILLKTFAEKIGEYQELACMGYTHLQPAEPTTLGYRFSFYAQDLLIDLQFLQFIKTQLKSKGFKGAVGTSASYTKLLDKNRAAVLEADIASQLGINIVDISNQTGPRKVEYLLGSLLSSISQSLTKFAFDLRIMQSPGFGEWQEPFGKNQVGSSAMPFKKNPIKSEQICSLARLIVNLSGTLWSNASHMLLERTLDDSANRRVVIPEMFLAADEILMTANKVLGGLIINEKRINKNLENYWPFSASEAILMEAVKKGADRQKMHETLRAIAMEAWKKLQDGEDNPMKDLLMKDLEIEKYLTKKEIEKLFDVINHLGNAPEKCKKFILKIKKNV